MGQTAYSVATLETMSFPPIGGLAAGMSRRRYAVLADSDRELIARLRRESALPVAAIAALLCTTETAVIRVCKEAGAVSQYSSAPYRRRSPRRDVDGSDTNP
jgi:hypothetical protein